MSHSSKTHPEYHNYEMPGYYNQADSIIIALSTDHPLNRLFEGGNVIYIPQKYVCDWEQKTNEFLREFLRNVRASSIGKISCAAVINMSMARKALDNDRRFSKEIEAYVHYAYFKAGRREREKDWIKCRECDKEFCSSAEIKKVEFRNFVCIKCASKPRREISSYEKGFNSGYNTARRGF